MMYFKNIHTGKKYLVIKLDKASNQIILRGETQEFAVPDDPELISRCGYELVEE